MTATSPIPATLARLDAARVAVLEWRQPRRAHRAWELTADGEIVARVAWRGPWRGGWNAETAEGEWRILHGFLGRCQILRESETSPIATSRRRGFRSVEILRAAGETLFWRRAGFFRAGHRLENREQFPLLTLERRRSFLRIEGTVALEEVGRVLPDVVPLILFSWTLALLQARGHAH